jgi:hypothetical protein
MEGKKPSSCGLNTTTSTIPPISFIFDSTPSKRQMKTPHRHSLLTPEAVRKLTMGKKKKLVPIFVFIPRPVTYSSLLPLAEKKKPTQIGILAKQKTPFLTER